MTFIDYVKLINNAVRFYPMESGKQWLIPQTFAVLDSITSLQAPNLGKYICDKNRPFFYSRKWETLKYNPSKLGFSLPVVLLFENAADFKGAFTDRAETTYNFDIVVLDRHSAEDCKKINCAEGVSRTIYEIYSDTEQILYNVLAYLDDVVVVQLLDGTITIRNSAHNTYLNDGAKVLEKETNSAKINLRKDNVQRAFHRMEPFMNADWFGVRTTFRFTIPNCRTVDFEFREGKGEIIDKGCC